MLEHDGVRVYHAGDTELLDDLTGFKANVCLLPIAEARPWTASTPCARVKTLNPTSRFPCITNTFDNIKQDPAEFKQKIGEKPGQDKSHRPQARTKV